MSSFFFCIYFKNLYCILLKITHHDYQLRSETSYAPVVNRVSKLFQLEKEYITGRGRQKDRVRARDLLCYWSVVDLARKFDITAAAVSYAVQRGEKLAKEMDYQLQT